jgi:hypothetical protein
MAGPLTHKTWLSIKDAAIRIGREQLRHAWRDSILARGPKDRTLRDIKSDLQKVLNSGEVEVRIDDGAGPTLLDPATADHFAFEIDIKKDCVFVHYDPERPRACRISADQLDKFLKRYRPSRAETSTRPDELGCKKWLVDLQKTEEAPWSKRRCEADARELFKEALIKAVLAIGTGVSVGDDLTFGRDCAG